MNQQAKNSLEELLTALFESAIQANHDFCGEQREWHVPRLSAVMFGMIELFPADAGAALMMARTPHGDLVGGEEGDG